MRRGPTAGFIQRQTTLKLAFVLYERGEVSHT